VSGWKQVWCKLEYALVTGGSRGIGRAIAEGFAREGATVAINYIQNKAAADETVQSIKSFGGNAIAIQADVRSINSVRLMVDEARREFGRIDILVNSAGVLSRIPFLELDALEFKRIIDTNLKGVFLTAQTVARVMVSQGEGVILNISSVCGQRPQLKLTHYCASKAAVSMLTKCMALELSRHGVRVNEICPGLIETDLNREDIRDPEFRKERVEKIPLGRVGQPRDLVEIAIYLCSDEASWITGASFVVDGGVSLV